MENPTTGEKSVSEMSIEELQAMIDQKKKDEQMNPESVDTSYVEMAKGNHPVSPEEAENIAEQIESVEAEIRAEIEMLPESMDVANIAITQAEKNLAADPDDIKSKVVLERIKDVYKRVLDYTNEIAASITLGGLGALSLSMAMYEQSGGAALVKHNQVLFDQAVELSELAATTPIAVVAVLALGHTLRKLQEKFGKV